jgi:hypothetical protein
MPRPQPVVPAQPVPDGLRACHSCDLPLSARASFCRRCGSAQVPLA